jgi:hypothetical protein
MQAEAREQKTMMLLAAAVQEAGGTLILPMSTLTSIPFDAWLSSEPTETGDAVVLTIDRQDESDSEAVD